MEPVFQDIWQVGIVVRDCLASVRCYADEYGIGPWNIYEFDPSTVSGMVVRDTLQPYAMRIAMAQLRTVQLELIEPRDDKSIYAEFLRIHGEGLHHVALSADDCDSALAFFRGKGFGILQGGDRPNARYTYVDTQAELGFISEIIQRRTNERPKPDSIYPPG